MQSAQAAVRRQSEKSPSTTRLATVTYLNRQERRRKRRGVALVEYHSGRKRTALSRCCSQRKRAAKGRKREKKRQKRPQVIGLKFSPLLFALSCTFSLSLSLSLSLSSSHRHRPPSARRHPPLARSLHLPSLVPGSPSSAPCQPGPGHGAPSRPARRGAQGR